MTNKHLFDIPELRALDAPRQLIRIPQQLDIPLSERVRQLIDTAEFRRLAHISQLGLVALVYPAAHHSRFEHSLGVYRLCLRYLKHLAGDSRFAERISPDRAKVLIAAALLHDVGHWPFCHPIEDIKLPGVPRHEILANSFLLEGELGDVLRHDWGLNPREVVELLSDEPRDVAGEILKSLLSGPIDIDKMDYLPRDSLHAGVPYGQNFDQQRLISSLCLNERGTAIAISDKGRTAAEMMVFSRYVMFSEVYWHHAVRSATSMLQRAFYLLYGQIDLDALFRTTEQPFIDHLTRAAGKGPAADLLEGLFGPTRQLYKRVGQYSIFQNRELYQSMARRPYGWLAACGETLAIELSHRMGRRIAPYEILIDAPPVHREVEFKVDVYFPKEQCYRPLAEVSPVVHTLAKQQFDDYVKRVRLFAHPDLANELQASDMLAKSLPLAIERAG